MALSLHIRHQAAIAGQVTDARTQAAVAGALVSITGAPAEFTGWLALRARQYGAAWANLLPRPDRAVTAPDGHFHFLDLPDGSYTLTATLPGSGSRYGNAQATAVVSRYGQGNIRLSAADISLPATAIAGRISGAANAALALAQIRVQGSGERTYSDAAGGYTLAAIETGNRTVQVTAQGYKPAAQTIQVAGPGAVLTLDFALAPLAG